MRVVPLWSKKIQLDNQEQCVYSVCFNPDGTQLIVAAGQRVLVYDTTLADTTAASLLQPLRGHKDTVHCVSYSYDGKRFASGSADKNVIIWTSKLEGVLKYGHSDSVQCLSWNPITGELASCSLSEFVFWSAEVKSVSKQKAGGRVTSCCWSPDGRVLAIGLTNGVVSLRQRITGEEKLKLERPAGPDTAVWALAFSFHRDDNNEVLCVTDWSQTLSFYTTNGKLIGKERQVGFEALDVKYTQDSEYIVTCGCNNTCSLFTREGIKLAQVGDKYPSWLWSVAPHPKLPHLALGCQDGTLSYCKLVFSTVHGLYKERYAYRENATDVIIQHLLTNQKVKIKCRDLVKRIAIYKHRLAVQLTEKIVVYELYSSEGSGMHYRVKEKLTSKTPCNLLVVTTNHIVLCQEKRLQCLLFNGVKEREWEMEAAIRYIKVVGGPPNRECLIVGLANGQVCKIFLDNAFPVNLLKINSSIRNLDLSQSKQKLAIVDDNLQCIVYDLRTKQPIYLERNADSVAWNSSYEDMLCFSGNNTLSIKAHNFPIHQQKLAGYVVGFCGSKIFCLNTNSITTLEVPLSAQMYQHLDNKQFNEAYLIACLGVTDTDWKSLAHAALEALDLDNAKKAFKRIKDLKYLELIADIEDRQKKGEKSRELLLADIFAYKGKYKEAAKLYQSSNNSTKALNMYTDLRMFDLAQDFVGSGDSVDRKALLRKKADWAQNINEPRAAAEMYLSAGDTLRAVDIMVDNLWVDMLVEVGRKAGKDEVEVLRKVGEGLRAAGDLNQAAHVYRKLGEEESVVKLLVEAKKWKQAFALVSTSPKYKHLVYVPYAQWLAENDNFLLAQKAYQSAGQPEEALRVLKQLTDNAVVERRFNDASYYYWLLAKQTLALASECQGNERDSLIEYYRKNEKIASLYYAYHTIYRYLEEPFTSCQPEALFNIARYLMQEIKIFRPPGISTFAILYALSKQARNLGAYKLARQVLDRMQTLRIPSKFQEYIDTATLLTKGKAYHDSEDLLVMCYRCSTYNPLMPPHHASPNSCTNCAQPFVHSFVTFEVLPLVEFELEEGVSDGEALKLLENQATVSDKELGWSQTLDTDVQALTLDDSLSPTVDPFTDTMLALQGSGEYTPIVVKKSMLESMDLTSVLVCKYPEPLRYRYFRNLMPGDMQVTVCPHCNKIFHIDDFEMKILEKGHCPFCRTEEETEEDSSLQEPV